MSTYFGSPAKRSNNGEGTKNVVFVLGGLILVLVCSLVGLLVKGNGSDEAIASVPLGQSSFKILVTKQRIEAGTTIEPHSLESKEVNAINLPTGAILERDKATVIGKYANNFLLPGLPLLQDDISLEKPNHPLNIPAGYRAISIDANVRQVVEYWATPNSRVDVLLTSKNPRTDELEVSTIVRFAKVLSLGGVTSEDKANQIKDKQTTVTLLVKEDESKYLELARNMGQLSLTLVGETDTVPLTANPAPITPDDILGRKKPRNVQGKIKTFDPETGQEKVCILEDGQINCGN